MATPELRAPPCECATPHLSDAVGYVLCCTACGSEVDWPGVRAAGVRHRLGLAIMIMIIPTRDRIVISCFPTADAYGGAPAHSCACMRMYVVRRTVRRMHVRVLELAIMHARARLRVRAFLSHGTGYR